MSKSLDRRERLKHLAIGVGRLYAPLFALTLFETIVAVHIYGYNLSNVFAGDAPMWVTVSTLGALPGIIAIAVSFSVAYTRWLYQELSSALRQFGRETRRYISNALHDIHVAVTGTDR